MEIIILHPQTKQESDLYEQLAKTLKTPYEISRYGGVHSPKKPSDFFGTMSKEEGEKMHTYVNKSREEWNRHI